MTFLRPLVAVAALGLLACPQPPPPPAVPDTSISAGPQGAQRATEATFSFSSTVAGATFACTLNGTSEPCSSPKAYSGLADGAYTFQVAATANGETDPSPAARQFSVDTAAPETVLDASGPQGTTEATSAIFTFSSPEASATFECRVDSGTFSACTSPVVLNNLDLGVRLFQVRALDALGNADASPASRTWTVADTTSPETALEQQPPLATNSTSATFAFSSSEAGSSFECSLDGQGFGACNSPKVYSGLSAGGRTFQVRARDASGNTDATPASYAWTVDLTAPNTNLLAGPSGTVSAVDARFEFNATETSTFECSLDGGAFAGCSSPHDLTALPEGAHTFAVRATDAAGNLDTTPASRSWTVNVAAPETTIDSAPPSPSTSSTAEFVFSSNEAGTFECRLVPAAFAACTSPRQYTGLDDGQYTFEVRATDVYGALDASPASHTWMVNTGAPNTTIDSGPSGTTSANGASFTYSSSKASSTFECKLDLAAYASCPATGISYSSLGEGEHTFLVRATDTLANVDPSPASRTWTVDRTGPTVTISAGPAHGSFTNARDASFTFSANETATFECSLDGATYAGCTSPMAYSSLGAGEHTFRVQARDGVNNLSTEVVRTWTIDLTAPVTSFLSGPSGLVTSADASFELSADELASFECRLDTDPFAFCTTPYDLFGLGQGEHTFEARAIDRAGNVDLTPVARTWTVDTVKPDTTLLTQPADPTSASEATFTFESDDATASFECQYDSSAWVSCSSPFVLGTGDGPHTFQVRALDPAGNQDPSPATWAWDVDLRAPVTTLAAGVGPVQGGHLKSRSATFEFSCDEAGCTFQCALDGASFSACTSPVAYSSLADGPHFFEVYSTDPVGNPDATPEMRSWTVDNDPPATTIESGPSGTALSSSASFVFSADETSAFQCSLDGAAFADCVSPVSYTGLADGGHRFEVRATDLAGNAEVGVAARDWTISTAGTEVITILGGRLGSLHGTASSPRAFEEREGAFDGPGIRLLKGLKPDIAALSEFNFRTNSAQDIADFVTNVFGPGYTYFRGTGSVATGVISRFPLCTDVGAASGQWDDPELTDREFSWMCLDIPGPKRLWVASIYLKAGATSTVTATGTNGDRRLNSANALVTNLQATVPAGDYIAIAGTVNTQDRSETCLTGGFNSFLGSPQLGLAEVARITGPYPADQSGGENSGSGRTIPSDWVLASPELADLAVPVAFGGAEFPSGLVFDSRVTPALTGIAPIDSRDSCPYYDALDPAICASGATAQRTQMFNMPVLRAFRVQSDAAPGAPETTLTAGPSGTVRNGDASFSFSGTNAASFECRLDGGTFAACTSPTSYLSLAEGSHTFEVRALNASGTADTTPAARTWTVNLAAPETSIATGPTGTVTTNSASFTFTSSETATFECQLDGLGWAACTSPKSYSNLGEGPHTFEVKAIDTLGDPDPSPATRAWTVDTMAPETTLAGGPAAFTQARDATFSFSCDEIGCTLECRVVPGIFSACTSPHTYTGLADGSYTFEVRSTDAVGNFDTTPAMATWKVDNVAPDTFIDSGPPATSTSASATFTFSSDESPEVTFACSLDGGAFVACSSPKTCSGLGNGTHSFAVKATDLAGNPDASADTHDWTVSVTGPTTTRITVMAANTTGGTGLQAYEEREGAYSGPGIRMFKGLQPDIVAINEWKFRTNTTQDFNDFVTNVFGPGFVWYREPQSGGIPNGVISRYPFCPGRVPNAGEWDDNDTGITDRDFAWACIDIPGPVDLWVVSVHLKASSGTTNEDRRLNQADQLVSYINANIPAGDYLVIAGDFNNFDRVYDADPPEDFLVGGFNAALNLNQLGLNQVGVIAAPYPKDQNGNDDTNSGRNSPYDWVMVDADLDAKQTPLVIGSSTYPDGLVFDSRVYTPLTEVAPIDVRDSCPWYNASNPAICATGSTANGDVATGMQHMPVMRAFDIPN